MTDREIDRKDRIDCIALYIYIMSPEFRSITDTRGVRLT